MSKDTLGDRIKRYERVSSHKLLPRTPLFIRVDGRAFHTYTRGAKKPFDPDIIEAMVRAATEVSCEMQGFKLAYVQSDEATFMLSDYDTHESQGWFDYELNKVVSISASAFTAHFNRKMLDLWTYPGGKSPLLAMFDSRAFSVPVDDAPNVFVWRQRDWERNSLQMFARSFFSHKELNGKSSAEIHDLLHGIGENWADLDDQLKNGTFILPDSSNVYAKQDYNSIARLINGQG